MATGGHNLNSPLGWGEDAYFEVIVVLDGGETGHGVKASDNEASKDNRLEKKKNLFHELPFDPSR
jgi:hypothetical protein